MGNTQIKVSSPLPEKLRQNPISSAGVNSVIPVSLPEEMGADKASKGLTCLGLRIAVTDSCEGCGWLLFLPITLF